MIYRVFLHFNLQIAVSFQKDSAFVANHIVTVIILQIIFLVFVYQPFAKQTHHWLWINPFPLVDLADFDLLELTTIHPKRKQTLLGDFKPVEVVEPIEPKVLNKAALFSQNELNQLCESLRC